MPAAKSQGAQPEVAPENWLDACSGNRDKGQDGCGEIFKRA